METSELHITWNIPYLLLAAAVAFTGTHVTVSLADQYRISCAIKPKLMGKHAILFLMAVTSGGVGTWTVHFVGTGALVLRDSDGRAIDRKFDGIYIVISLCSAIVVTYVALLIACMDTLHTKSRDEIYKTVVDDSLPGSAGAVRSRSMLIRKALTTRLEYLVFGGIVGSAGICATHYIGNLALFFPVRVLLDPLLTSISTFIAFAGSVLSYWLLFRLHALYPEYEKFRFAYIAVAMVSVCGMHFCGVAATTYELMGDGEYGRVPLGPLIESDVAVQSVLTAGLIFSFAVNALILAQKRLWTRDFMTANRRVTKMMERLSQDPKYQNEAFVSEYFTSTAHIREVVSSSIKLDRTTLFRGSSKSSLATSKVNGVDSRDQLDCARDVVHGGENGTTDQDVVHDFIYCDDI